MIRSKIGLVVVCLSLVLAIAGCGSSNKGPISVNVSPQTAYLGSGQTMQFTASVTNDTSGVTWSVSTSDGADASVDTNGNFTAPTVTQNTAVTVTATSVKDSTKSASATIMVIAPGIVATTANPQVALYTITVPDGLSCSVQFSTDTSYGFTTWAVPAPSGGGAVPILVAGMKGNTEYHMRAVFAPTNATSSVFTDADHTFTTVAYPAAQLPNLTATTTAGMTPQSGVELVDAVITTATTKVSESFVSDLSGNVIWAYVPTATTAAPNPIKLLPNGHFLIVFSGQPDGVNTIVQEVDLGSNVIWELSTAQINTALSAATCAECNVTINGLHHDFQVLANGHMIVLASTSKLLSDGTTALGDVILDLGDMENVGGNNPNHVPQPVWAWNEFNHLDTNRRPYMYPDWTHTNALIYSKDDGNLIISIRHQNWLVKIDYSNGAGAGDILWKLGAVLPTDTTPEDTADFTLLNADGTPDTKLTDWFYAQHGPSFTTTNTTGTFGLVLFDNGDDRDVSMAPGDTCGGALPACFSTVSVFTIDETAKTATFVINPTTPDYSLFGGNAEILSNGNLEYDECEKGSGSNAAVFEVTQSATPQSVWELLVTGQNAYRAMRIPSLYPGVRW